MGWQKKPHELDRRSTTMTAKNEYIESPAHRDLRIPRFRSHYVAKLQSHMSFPCYNSCTSVLYKKIYIWLNPVFGSSALNGHLLRMIVIIGYYKHSSVKWGFHLIFSEQTMKNTLKVRMNLQNFTTLYHNYCIDTIVHSDSGVAKG